jgi:protein TonB
MKRLMLMSGSAALIWAAAVAGAAAQDPVQTVRDLYAAAAYEDALAAASRLQGERPQAVEQYRVYSLTALGRHEEAQKAMEALVRADPAYVLDPAETPPRVQEAFTKVQQRLLPVVTKDLYQEARAALDRKDRDEAIGKFEKLLKIIDGAGPSASSSLGELRVLADGFLDLSRALPTAEKTAAANTDDRPAAPPAAPPAAGLAPPPTIETRPVAIEQGLPSWVPTDTLSRRSSFSGAVLVRIGTDGRVESAEIERGVHPTYDAALIRAARQWRYQPATRNGLPIASELTVEVTLRPPQ